MSVSLAKVATEFLDRPGLAPSTVRSYESTLLPVLKQYGRWPIELLDRESIGEYLNDRKNLSYTTHHRHQAILQALFNFAVEQGYIRVNPLAGLRRRKPNPEKGEHQSDQTIHYLTTEQLTVLYQQLRSDNRLYTLVKLLHCSGARISEVLALDESDMDWGSQKFQVLGKGNKQRWCFYNDEAAQLLEKYRKYYRFSGHSALFTAKQPMSGHVTRLSYSTAYHRWRTLTNQNPLLRGLRLHDLRHTFATERVGLMGIEELRALMGHEKIETTLRYQKVTSERAKYIAKKAFQKL
ncbi:recombinase XerC [Picosynechococcus sp. PCC 7003]|uniref:tyrosine-type recombinase/integrase n=1 Tax=Picosynechococcus sp. PCC 7003 TaxID=374981 RepID=UPI000810609C|nr:tyrosine-type recombinase/integrase [Picosynechococcus sp. PCC 7003]ANV84115.1 recombinase XerC [Picosynechococcus sp. PCC 7003]